MRCNECGVEFVTSIEDEQLIERGDMEALCKKCELERYLKVARETPAASRDIGGSRLAKVGDAALVGMAEDVLPIGRKIYRVELRNLTTGKIESFIEIRRPPLRRRSNILLPRRKHGSHVALLRDRAVSTNTPPHRIHTNLGGFLKERRNLWFKKVPAFVDGFTGGTNIELGLTDILGFQWGEHNDETIYLIGNLKNKKLTVFYDFRDRR